MDKLKRFHQYATERAVKTFAQTMLGVITASAAMSIIEIDFVQALGVSALAFVVFFTVLCLTALLFMFAGREQALAIGFMASQRNLALMLAATGGVLPDFTWLYFALSQFPIYLLPHLLRPLARRILARAPIAAERAS